MKSILVISLLALVIACQAQTEVHEWKFAAALDSTSTPWNAPTFNSTGACISSTDSPSNSTNVTITFTDLYKSFSYNLAEDSFVRAIGLVTKNLGETGSLFIYNGTFNDSLPCENLIISLTSGSLDSNPALFTGLNFEIAGWLKAGTYWFVFSIPAPSSNSSTSTSSASEYVVVNIEKARDSLSGSIDNTTFLAWKVPQALADDFTGNATCALDAAVVVTPKIFLGTFTLDEENLSVNNKYDILAYLQHADTLLVLDQPIVALYKGDLSGFTQTNSSDNSTITPALVVLDPCTDFANFTLISITKGKMNDLTTRLTATLLPGEIYSVIVSGTHTEDTGHVGVFVKPSVIGDVSDEDQVNKTFSVPTVIVSELNGTTTFNCTDDGAQQSTSFDVYRFIAESDTYLLKAWSLNFEPFVIVYNGNITVGTPISTNVTNSTSTNSTSCDNFLLSGNTNVTGPLVLNTIVGSSYTIVVTPDAASAPTPLLSGKYYFFLLSGDEKTQGTVTGLSTSTDQAVKTVDLAEVSSANLLNVGIALIAMIVMMIVL